MSRRLEISCKESTSPGEMSTKPYQTNLCNQTIESYWTQSNDKCFYWKEFFFFYRKEDALTYSWEHSDILNSKISPIK